MSASEVERCAVNFSATNLTEYVLEHMGPPCVTLDMKVITILVYGAIFLVGVLGNACTLIVITQNAYMHTATNYYLCSLAVSDLLTLLTGLPFEYHSALTVQWPSDLPEWLCKARGFISECTSYCSILTISMFSFERWLAICFPFRVHTFAKFSRVMKTIIAIWLTAFLSATPLLVYVKINRLKLPHAGEGAAAQPDQFIVGTEMCSMDAYNIDAQRVIINCSFWVFFIIPMLLMTALFTHIGLVLRKTAQDSKRAQRVAVAIAFFVCWLPFHLQRIFIIVSLSEFQQTQFLQNLVTVIFYISGYFYYANSAVNPILYNVLNRKFRHAFLRTLFKCLKPLRRTRDASESNEDLSHSQSRSKHKLLSTIINKSSTSNSPRSLLRIRDYGELDSASSSTQTATARRKISPPKQRQSLGASDQPSSILRASGQKFYSTTDIAIHDLTQTNGQNRVAFKDEKM